MLWMVRKALLTMQCYIYIYVLFFYFFYLFIYLFFFGGGGGGGGGGGIGPMSQWCEVAVKEIIFFMIYATDRMPYQDLYEILKYCEYILSYDTASSICSSRSVVSQGLVFNHALMHNFWFIGFVVVSKIGNK